MGDETRRGRDDRTGLPSDGELVAAVRAGRRSAFDELYLRHAGAVRRVLTDNVDDHERRHELVQETFTRALAKIDHLQDPDRFRPWVFQIARNLAIDDLRERTRLPTQRIDDTDDAALGLDEDESHLALEVGELAVAIRDGFAQLSERDATAVSMVAHLGFGPAEVAAALDISHGNAKVVLHRARHRLRAAVEASQQADHRGTRRSVGGAAS